MAIKRREIPIWRRELSETSSFRKAMRHPLIQDFVRLDGYDDSMEYVGNLYPLISAATAFPVHGLSGPDHVFFYAVAAISFHEYGESFLSDKAYRALDNYLHHNLHRLMDVKPVGRAIYHDEIPRFLKEHGFKYPKGVYDRWGYLTYKVDRTLGKNLAAHWHKPKKLLRKSKRS